MDEDKKVSVSKGDFWSDPGSVKLRIISGVSRSIIIGIVAPLRIEAVK